MFPQESTSGNQRLDDLLMGLASAINGLSSTASSVVEAVEAITLRKDLRHLTLLGWQELVSSARLVRPQAAWCPKCFDDLRGGGETCYEQLLWVIKEVTFCPKHRIPLIDRCAICNKMHRVLSWGGRCGFCPHCKSWLGSQRFEDKPLSASSPSEGVEEWALWKSQAAAQMVQASATTQIGGLGANEFPRNCRLITKTHLGGKITALAETCFTRRHSVQAWIRGESKPMLSSVLMLAYRLQVSPIDLLCRKDCSGMSIRNCSAEVISKFRRRVQSRHQGDREVERFELEKVVAQNPTPAPSFSSICIRLKVHHAHLKQRFPDLAAIIQERNRAYRLEQSKAKERRITNELRTTVEELIARGESFTSNRVACLMRLKSASSYRNFRKAFDAVMSERNARGENCKLQSLADH